MLPYGHGTVRCSIPCHRFRGEVVSRLNHYAAGGSQEELVREALENPIGTPRLSVMAEGKRNIVLIASDHTRPVPSKIIIPQMLAELRKGSPDAEITILIATGCHRETTLDELHDKFGPSVMASERIVVHDCDSPDMTYMGKLPSGGGFSLNRIAAEADLLVAEGFIEPHFFAGFSGGRKSVLPGIANREAVLYNHNAEFIAHSRSRAGVTEGNPIHNDMLYAGHAARLRFICNVVINSDKDIVYAVAGDCDLAHKDGREFLAELCTAKRIPADIVISTNGGYPLDRDIYQAVKGMTAGEACVNPGGVIIMLAQSADGHGAPEFYKTFRKEKDLVRMTEAFLNTPKEHTRADQWQSQIFARVLRHARVIYVSDAPDEIVRDLHMVPSRSVQEALRVAERMLGDPGAGVAVVRDGVGVIINGD